MRERAKELDGSPLAIAAAKNMDWQQVVLNGGPPCFFFKEGRFCGRAQRWAGHTNKDAWPEHRFVSFADLLTARQTHLQALADALRLVLLWRDGPEGPDVLFEEGATMIKRARATLDDAWKAGFIK